jgi:uncharacterized damage-inducible protein DinB
MLNQSLIAEIKQEGAQTRRMLEAVPFDNPGWKPHEKSMTIARLATHIAEIPAWTSMIATLPEFDITSVPLKRHQCSSREELLELHDKNIEQALSDLQRSDDAALMTPWAFKRGEQVIFQLPRIAAIRTLGMNHLLHHRGQLSVYLRLLNTKVPGMYGPSADDMS